MNDFYLTLPSNTVPENTTSKFSVHLPNKLSLHGSWEVALVEIQYPYSWNNLQETKSGWSDNRIDITFKDNSTQSMFVPSNHYDTIHDLLGAIEYTKIQTNRRIKKSMTYTTTKRKSKLNVISITNFRNGFFFEFEETLKRVRCRMQSDYITNIKLSPRLQYMLGFKHQVLKKAKTLASFQADIRGGFYSLFVYCSLVEPQVVGNVTAPLLRNVHISGLHGEMIEKLFQTPHYVPVVLKEIDRIEMDIKDDNNLSVPFQFGKTVVKLHFRKKRSIL
jgi:hypothetical protein